ncbi:MAG: hypothetical protein FJW35_11890, partial [Acidobacteria bacterium]|nr:hypothetical protein [Acidobacteriota bacterium]
MVMRGQQRRSSAPDKCKRHSIAVACVVIAILFWPRAVPAQGTLRWVEVQLVLDSSGRAEVTYRTRWRTPGTMRGFYFEGETAAPDFRGGEAELPDGSRVPLAITAVQPGRWDVVLSGERAWGPGEATYTFSYRADFAAFGLAEATRAGDGSELVVLNWSPVSWDAPLEHQTLMVTFATVPAPGSGDLSFEEAAAAGFRTEPFVNARYRISYRGVGDPPALWVRFHRDGISAGEDHRIQVYFPASRFEGVAAATRSREAARAEEELREREARQEARLAAERSRERDVLVQLWIPRAALFVVPALLVLVAFKLKGIARAQATAPDILWERDDWEPPRLRLQTFRKPGKVAELGYIEALVLLGLPFQVVLAIVFDLLSARGLIRRESMEKALRIARQGTEPPNDDPYLAFAWKALPSEPALPPADLAGRLGELLVGTVQRKAWDSDLDATRDHYRHLFAELFPDVAAVESRRCESPTADYADYYPWWVSRHHTNGPGVWR